MTAKVYDLSSYLEQKKATIKLGARTYEISDGFNDLLKIDALTNRRDQMENTEFIQEFLSISLGAQAAKELIEMNMPIKFYTEVMECIEKTYRGDDEQEGVSSGQEDKGFELV